MENIGNNIYEDKKKNSNVHTDVPAAFNLDNDQVFRAEKKKRKMTV